MSKLEALSRDYDEVHRCLIKEMRWLMLERMPHLFRRLEKKAPTNIGC
jgi:hypothetical protein